MLLATALCKNLPAENTERQLSRPKPTRVAAPIEEEGAVLCYADGQTLQSSLNAYHNFVNAPKNRSEAQWSCSSGN